MSRLAIVSYWAPPQGAVASHRILRLTRLLLREGHQVHWITLDPRRITKTDATLEKCIPEAVVRHGLGGPCLVTKPRAEGILEKVLRTVVYKLPEWFAVPDGYVEWTWRLRHNIDAILHHERIDTALFSCGPHGTIMALPRLRRKLPDLRMVVDYRDILSGNFWRESSSPRRRRKLVRRERRALKAADAILLNTEDARLRFEEVVQPPPELEVRVMRNAADYDLADRFLAGSDPVDLGEGVHLGYFGTVFPRRRLRPVLAAINALPSEVAARVKFHCYCNSWSRALLDEDRAAEGGPAAGCVVHHEPVPFGVALQAMRAMDLLLLVNGATPEDRIFVPGKLFDYLMSRRPVLFVGEKGDAWKITAACCGERWCSRHTEPERRVAALAEVAAERPPDLPPCQAFTPERTFAPLLAILRE